ncbi:MAG TPA: lipid II flippase MurJ [Candidatus Paceibacterota bacterium]|nr:lipid II flippase MurJ [Candidatus Paceibacterota bacterium]
MVRKILSSLTAPVRGLHQAAYVLAGLTLASQALALLRDRLFAHSFGAGDILDLYYAAFKIPDLVFALVASLVSAYVLIPRIAGGKREESKALISQTATFLFVAGGLLCGVLAIFARPLLFMLFPDAIASPNAEEFVLLARVLLIQPIILGLSGIATSVTQVKRRFVLFALSPVLYNIGIIVGTVFLYPHFGLLGIGMGVVGGAFAHLLIHIPVLIHEKLFPRLVILSPRALWEVIRDSVPRSLALAVGSLTALVLTILAAQTGEGSIAVLSLALNLQAVPLSLIAASYATAAFPVLAESMEAKRYDAFKITLSAAARHIIFWSAILSVLVLVLRAHVVRIVLGSGAFDWDATRITAAILALLVVGLMAQGLVLLASRAFYAAQKSWNPLLIQIGGLVVSVGSAVGLLALATAFPDVRYFIEALLRVEDVPGTDILLIATGAMLGHLSMGVFALITLHRVAPGVSASLVRPMFEGLAAAILGGTATYGVLSFLGNLAPLTTLAYVFTEAALAGMVGLAVSAAVLALLANKEFKDLTDSLRKLKLSAALKPSGPVLSDRTDA